MRGSSAAQRAREVGVLKHHCHATGCRAECKPEYLMCFSHWSRVPRDIQRAVWANYRAGQCDDKNPSEAWHEAADAAIGAVAMKAGFQISTAQRTALVKFGYEKLADGVVRKS